MPWQWADNADVLVYHTGVPDNWVVRSQAPIITIIHGRPLATFRPEQNLEPRNGYTLLNMLGDWPRLKKAVYFWPEHTPYWRNIMPEEKLVAIDFPPIDLKRFTPEGPVHEFGQAHRGKYNALIADAWRPDIDCFEIANGAIEAAKLMPGLKVHFYSVETMPDTSNLTPCWTLLLNTLSRFGAGGELNGRQPGLEEVFRAVDFVMSPNRIVTRIIGEALACGVPVLAAEGCKVTPYTADIFNPEEVGQVARRLVKDLENDRGAVKAQARATAEKLFNLERYSDAIDKVYEEVAG
jgi:glycosyltransferase involved in cell wall biosynthesis